MDSYCKWTSLTFGRDSKWNLKKNSSGSVVMAVCCLIELRNEKKDTHPDKNSTAFLLGGTIKGLKHNSIFHFTSVWKNLVYTFTEGIRSIVFSSVWKQTSDWITLFFLITLFFFKMDSRWKHIAKSGAENLVFFCVNLCFPNIFGQDCDGNIFSHETKTRNS